MPPLICQVIAVVSLAILVARPADQALHMAGYFLNYVGA